MLGWSMSRGCVGVLVAQLCLTLCNPMDCSLPGSSVHGILQARILEWLPLSRGSSQPRDQTWVYCIAGGFFTRSATREAHVTYTHILLDRGGCVVKTKVTRIRGILPKEKNDKGEVGGGNR